MRRGISGDVFKMVCFDRRMDRAARLRVNQGESEGPVSAEAPPWQGVFVLADACRGVVERSRKSADLPVRLPARRRRWSSFMRPDLFYSVYNMPSGLMVTLRSKSIRKFFFWCP